MAKSTQLAILILLAIVTLLAISPQPTSTPKPTVELASLAESVPDPLATTSTYYTIRRDVRRCASPLCGGYFVKRVNQASTRCADGRNQSSCYVTNIEWEGQPEVEPQLALLRGTIVSRGNRRGTYGILQVSESWRAASNQVGGGDFFRVKDRGLRCIAAPCETHHEARLNTTIRREIAGVKIEQVGAAEATLSEAYSLLTGQDGILVAGHHSPVTGPAGRSVTMTATQFYLRPKSAISMKPCIKTGCSSEICAEEEMMSACVYKAEYECYKKARCERQSNGNCGFTQTTELQACVKRR